MKLWLDDVRLPPDGWIWAMTAQQAIDYLKTGNFEEISLDHDLGDEVNGTGYDVAKFIEEEACTVGKLPPLKWSIHSSNPVGRANMQQAMTNAELAWANVEMDLELVSMFPHD